MSVFNFGFQTFLKFATNLNSIKIIFSFFSILVQRKRNLEFFSFSAENSQEDSICENNFKPQFRLILENGFFMFFSRTP